MPRDKARIQNRVAAEAASTGDSEMNAQKVTYRTRPIITTSSLCIGVLAGVFVIGVDPARASVIIADGLQILANSSQTQPQTELDLYACATWATDQTGFDPITHPGGTPPVESTASHSEYRRAMGACLQARGYTVSMATPPAPAVSPAPRPIAAVSPANSLAPPGKWEFLGKYQSPMGVGPVSAVIDLTSSYNYDYVVYYVWVGGGFAQRDGNWTPGSTQWAFSNVDINCQRHTFREHRFINQAGPIPRSDDRWIAIEDAWQPIQLAEKQVCEQFQ
jgi:hypothetical protein